MKKNNVLLFLKFFFCLSMFLEHNRKVALEFVKLKIFVRIHMNFNFVFLTKVESNFLKV